jgi:hypothetical protein
MRFTEKQLAFLRARMSTAEIIKVIKYVNHQLTPSGALLDVEAIRKMTHYLTKRL